MTNASYIACETYPCYRHHLRGANVNLRYRASHARTVAAIGADQ